MALPSGTNYPGAIDGVSNGFGAVSTGQTITAPYANDQTSAILAIENALGTNPQGAYSTVSAALSGLTASSDSGTANAYKVTLSPTPSSYTTGQVVLFVAAHANTGASTLAVNSLSAKGLVSNGGSAFVGGEIAAGQVVAAVYDGTQFQMLTPAASTQVTLNLLSQTNDFRLTFVSGTPLRPDANDLGAYSTLYLTSYIGNRIALFDGTNWQVLNTSEISIDISGLADGNWDLWDVFVYNASGTPTLELGPLWTDFTTRSAALTLQDGVWVKASDTTRRYVGTLMKDDSDYFEDNPEGRYLYNADNRVPRLLNGILIGAVSTNSSTWAPLGWYPSTNYVMGLTHESVMGTFTAWAVGADGAAAEIALGVTNDPSTLGGTPDYWGAMGATAGSDWLTAVYCKLPDSIGAQSIIMYERSNTDGVTVTFGGDPEEDWSWYYVNLIGFAWM